MARLCWRYSCHTTELTTRVGLRLIVVGAISGLVYQAHRVVFYAAPRFEFDYIAPGPQAVLDWLLTTVSHVLILIGATMPGWGPRVGLPGALAWLSRLRAHQRLRPLWFALYQADPRIALVPPGSRLVDALSPRDLDLRLYRRIIEIRDGRLMLLPYLDPNAATEAQERAAAAGLTGQQLDAEVEAAIFAAALQAKALGSVPPVPAPPPASTPGGTDIDSDVSFLCAVASAFRRHHRTVPRTSEGATDRETVIG